MADKVGCLRPGSDAYPECEHIGVPSSSSPLKSKAKVKRSESNSTGVAENASLPV